MPSKREQDLEAIVRRLMPATRDVMWCALVWNDHNFSESDLLDKAKQAAKALGYERTGLRDAIKSANEFIAHVDAVLAVEGKASNETVKP
jgi:hypothetical protein